MILKGNKVPDWLIDRDRGKDGSITADGSVNVNDCLLVSTPYGRGRLKEQRSSDGMYVVELLSIGDVGNSFATLYTAELQIEADGPARKIPEGPVFTPFGTGRVVDYRAEDGMFVVQLMRLAASGVANESFAVLYTKEVEEPTKLDANVQVATQLDVAYQALEKMRRLNLEMQCHEVGIAVVDFDCCTTCLLSEQESTKTKAGFSRFRKPQKRPKAPPCLVCGSPSCRAHSSLTFRKEGITLCCSCERFFEIDFIMDCASASDPKERTRNIENMIDLYDRSLLLLKYSAQYIDTIARVLERKKQQRNRIGLSASSVSVASGVLGLAAAASILTPAGPPLLIASLVFGSGATAVQTSADAINHFSEPNKLADRIIAFYGMIRSLLRVTGTLRDAMMRDHIRTDAYVAEDVTDPVESMQKAFELHKNEVMIGTDVGRGLTLGSVASAEVTAIGARTGTALSRAGTAAARAFSFAQFAGGALSAAVLVVEANAIKSTIRSMRAGNPCEKASTLRAILKEVESGGLPSTESLDSECQSYLKVLNERVAPDALPVAKVDIATQGANFSSLPVITADNMVPTNGVAVSQSNALVLTPTSSTIGGELSEPGSASVLLGGGGNVDIPVGDVDIPVAVPSPARNDVSNTSLLQRIQLFRRRPESETSGGIPSAIANDRNAEQVNLVV